MGGPRLIVIEEGGGKPSVDGAPFLYVFATRSPSYLVKA